MLIELHKPEILPFDSEVDRMARHYIEYDIIPESEINDAFHIGYSTYHEMNILLSWNYKHLANVFRKKKVVWLNLEEGYDKPLDIVTPMEVLQDGE